MTDPITVMVVDDHPMWIDAVGRDLESAGCFVVGSAADGASACRRVAVVQPDVLVLDLHLPDMTGVEVVAEVLRVSAQTRVLILSASGEPQDVLAAVKAGATGYLVKSASKQELLHAVQQVASNEPVFTPGLAGLMLGEFRRSAGAAPSESSEVALTPRELEVLKLVARGLSYKDVAARLVISHRTVQNHVQNILGKLHLSNRVELARYAMEHGLDGDDT